MGWLVKGNRQKKTAFLWSDWPMAMRVDPPHLIVSFSQFFGVFVSLYRLDYTCSEADFTHVK